MQKWLCQLVFIMYNKHIVIEKMIKGVCTGVAI